MLERRRVDIAEQVERDWDAIREEYVAGGVTQRALAERYGIPYTTLKRRAAAGKWSALRDAVRSEPAEDSGGDSDTDIALRTRRKLLTVLERMADDIPGGALTEYKTQDDSAVRLFRLKDFTSAYKELTGDLPLGDEGRDEVKVIIDT